MSDVAQALSSIPWPVVGGIGSWGLTVALLSLLIRERHRNRLLDNAEDRQRVELGIQMLEMAQTEIKRLGLELADARVWTDVLAHLAEAERHLTALISADPDELDHAKRDALQFLKRMERLREARGTARNEMQIVASEGRLEGHTP